MPKCKIKRNGAVKLHVTLKLCRKFRAGIQGAGNTRRIKPVEDGELESVIDERRQEFASLIPVEDRASEKATRFWLIWKEFLRVNRMPNRFRRKI